MNIAAFLLLAISVVPAATQQGAGASEQPKKEKLICKRIGASESRLAAKRICRTAEAWKKAQDAEDAAGN